MKYLKFRNFIITLSFLLIIIFSLHSIMNNYASTYQISSSAGHTLYFGGSTSAKFTSAECGNVPQYIVDTLNDNNESSWYCPISTAIYSEWKSYLTIAIIVVLIALSVDIILFMLGVVLRDDRIKNIGIGEMYEAFASALIVFLFMFVSAVVFGIIPGIYVGNINPYVTSTHLMTETIITAEGLYSNIFDAYALDKVYFSMALKVHLEGGLGSFISDYGDMLYGIPLEALNINFIQPASYIMNLLADGIAFLYSEYYLIIFFSAAAIPVFIIPGVIFRIVPPTRGLGGMLLAIGIGFYLVMPTLFAAVYYFTSTPVLTELNVATVEAQQTNAEGVSGLRSFSSSSPASSSINTIESTMSSFYLMILFYPMLIITITYAFIQVLAQFIGGSAHSGGKLRGFI